jgi:hypothetical protein
MFYVRRADGNPIAPDKVLELSSYLNNITGPLEIPDWGIEIPDVREVLGKVLVMPYNGSTIGIPNNGTPDGKGPYRRNKVISTILSAGYKATGLPNESWTRDKIVRFMGFPEEEMGERCIYLPPEGGNRIKLCEIKKKK